MTENYKAPGVEFDRPLTDYEIGLLAKGFSPGLFPGLVKYYPLLYTPPKKPSPPE